MSILHPPGEDEWGYESSAERWRPINSVESVLVSLLALLSDPNDESPANVDASVLLYSFAGGSRLPFPSGHVEEQ